MTKKALTLAITLVKSTKTSLRQERRNSKMKEDILEAEEEAEDEEKEEDEVAEEEEVESKIKSIDRLKRKNQPIQMLNAWLTCKTQSKNLG